MYGITDTHETEIVLLTAKYILMIQEMNIMLCGYESCQTDSRCADSYSRCMKGIMILVGIIGGLIFAAAVILLFINSLIPSVFGAVLASLITGLVLLALTLGASLFLPCGSEAKACLSCNTGGLFFGIIGTVLSAFIAISTDLASTSAAAIITVGLTAFFFAYTVISVLFTVLCSTRCSG